MKIKPILSFLMIILLLTTLCTAVAADETYPIWNIDDTKTITLQSGETTQYSLAPSESGKYMVRTTEGIQFDVKNDLDDDLGTEFTTSDGVEGMVYELTAGQQYVVSLQNRRDFADSATGTFCFEKVGAVKSASIYVAGFTRYSYILGIDFDPICGSLEGVTWSVSDPSVFTIAHESDTALELDIRNQGKATITAQVGNVSASIELSSEPKLPVLAEGETLNLTIDGTAAEFISAQYGEYEFTVVPNRTMTFRIYDDADNDLLYNNQNLSEKIVFTMALKEGQTYELSQRFGRCSVSVKYVGESSQGSNEPTETQPVTTPPNSPTTLPQDVTEPTQATELTAPSETIPAGTNSGITGTQSNNHILWIVVPVVLILIGGGIASFLIVKKKTKK